MPLPAPPGCSAPAACASLEQRWTRRLRFGSVQRIEDLNAGPPLGDLPIFHAPAVLLTRDPARISPADEPE
jgi:hypothetical protein